MDKVTYGASDNLRTSSAERSNTQVSEQVQLQGKLISELAGVIDRLGENLSSVCRQVPIPMIQEGKDTEQLVPLALNIKEHNEFLIRNIQRIDTIINTLEL